MSPAWSPDGTQIAFHRMAGADTGIYVVPALGGPERKLRSTRMPGRGLTSPISVGRRTASGSPSQMELPVQETVVGMYLLSTETLETRQIPISPKCDSEGLPAFSHNGEYLAYWCFRSGSDAVLYSLPIPGWSAENDFIISGFSKWINLVG